MNLHRIFLFGTALISFFFTLNVSAATVIDNNAPTVSLRTACTEAGGSVFINNCFTDMSTLANWMTSTRKPNVSAPLLVEIGPGNFSGLVLCVDPAPFSYVTFRGAGMKKSTIGRLTLGSGCTELTFQDLTVTQQQAPGYAVTILNPGLNTTWNGVFLKGDWIEYGAGVCNPGKHYWFHSRISGQYSISCDQSWFFGSEIAGETTYAGPGLYDLVAIAVANKGEAHIYGSNINASKSDSGTAIANRHVAVSASGGGKVHIHGTGIDVISNTASNIVALEVGVGGEIHANESAYNMKTAAGGAVTRILNPNNVGHVHAPYVWQEHAQPPGINSQNGADMTVQTGCAANGCQNAGTETHLLIYNTSCAGAGGPWFDVVTRACR